MMKGKKVLTFPSQSVRQFGKLFRWTIHFCVLSNIRSCIYIRLFIYVFLINIICLFPRYFWHNIGHLFRPLIRFDKTREERNTFLWYIQPRDSNSCSLLGFTKMDTYMMTRPYNPLEIIEGPVIFSVCCSVHGYEKEMLLYLNKIVWEEILDSL